MDIATMVAINNLNMVTMMQAMQQTQSVITILADGKEIKDMEGSMLDQYMGKNCTISLFNEVGAIKGTFEEADSQWIKVDQSGCREKGNSADQPEYGQKYYI